MGRYVTQVWPPGTEGHEYGAYIPHPIWGWSPQLSRRVLDRIAAAGADISHTVSTSAQKVSYRWAGDSIMAQGESLSSSAIEGIYASLEGMSIGADGADALNRAALGNWEMAEQAMSIAEDGGPIAADDILDLHSTLMARSDTPHLAGELRRGPVWVGTPAVAGMGPIGARFVPPPAGEVRPLLDDLVEYINYSDHEPVLRAAVVHAQFESIHPFPDGNGRTGRALIPIALFSGEDGDPLHLPISRALLANRNAYYDSLHSFQRYEGPPDDPIRSAGLEPWIELFADSVQRAAEQVRKAADLTDDLMRDWRNRLGGIRPDSAVWKIASELAFRPVFTAESLESELGSEASMSAIRRGVARLRQAGIVQEVGRSGRAQVYRAAEIISLAENVLGLSEAISGGVATRAEDLMALQNLADDSASAGTRDSRTGRATTAWQCTHWGKRTEKQCIRSYGHQGQHRYD